MKRQWLVLPLALTKLTTAHHPGFTSPTSIPKFQFPSSHPLHATTRDRLHDLLAGVKSGVTQAILPPSHSNIGARTITGLLHALAEDVQNLSVLVDADPTTPHWNKTVHSVRIHFSRLGFRQLRMGGHDHDATVEAERVLSVEEAFERMDVDGSGALDAEELVQALKMLWGRNTYGAREGGMLREMAGRLVRLYDENGDGVVDRGEYEVMVRDMAALREERLRGEVEESSVEGEVQNRRGWLAGLFQNHTNDSSNGRNESLKGGGSSGEEQLFDITENESFWGLADQGGSFVLEDLRLDLRQLVFGTIPIIKRLLPGGPLILKPFTATITASFNREDLMNSFLIDAGLRRLVARALCRRVRGIRDLFDGAVFNGRTWKLLEHDAPLVEVPKLQDVQFDHRNRLIITGRARIKAAPDSPSIENGFKLRTKIGTRGNGRIIGLLEPEIAVFAECPKAIETNVRKTLKSWFDYTIPRFQPLYTFIPLVSPLRKNDTMDGFNLGDDNQIKSIEIKNGKLFLEISAFLRPGKFLGNYYLAFTVPIRTLIITLDRVKEGIRTARRNKRLADKAAREMKFLARLNFRNSYMRNTIDDPYGEALAQSISGMSFMSNEGGVRLRRLEKELKEAIQDQTANDGIDSVSNGNTEERKSFISRFVEGYSGVVRYDGDFELKRLSSAISDFFGRQEPQGEEEV